jgi:hypothetical protein
VPGFYGGWVFVDWEELHVDCVGIIYSTSHQCLEKN